MEGNKLEGLEDNTSGDSFTKQYTTYKIQKGNPGTFYLFVFNDIMGLEPQGGGVHVDDAIRQQLDSLEAPEGIPQVAILTKVDMACPEVEKDLRNIYRSKYIKEKMEEFSAKVGILMNSIFPVKNYHEETDLSDHIDSLILNAMRHIINFGEDFVNRKKYST